MDCVERMLRNETLKAMLVEWAVEFAEFAPGKNDHERAMRACKQVCAIWRQAITRPVLDRLEQQPQAGDHEKVASLATQCRRSSGDTNWNPMTKARSCAVFVTGALRQQKRRGQRDPA